LQIAYFKLQIRSLQRPSHGIGDPRIPAGRNQEIAPDQYLESAM
jgi:hypothetical protein